VLTDDQINRINAIIAAGKTSLETAKNPPKSSSLFGVSSGVAPSSGGAAETKVRSDAAVAAALKNTSPAEILAAWTAAHTSSAEDPNAAFLEAFKNGRKLNER
jgi:hypothetical protein